MVSVENKDGSNSINYEMKINIVDDFMADLKHSGYTENERISILKAGYKRVENIMRKVNEGKIPFFRPNSFEKETSGNHKSLLSLKRILIIREVPVKIHEVSIMLGIKHLSKHNIGRASGQPPRPP